MKLAHLVVLAIGLVVSAVRAESGGPTLPACALNCMAKLIPLSACSATDQVCICTNQQLQVKTVECVKSACSVKEQLATTAIAAQVCQWPVHDKHLLIEGATISAFVTTTLFFFVRITARMPFVGGEIGADDYMMCVTYACAIAYSVLLLMLSSVGLGRDIWTIPFSDDNDQVTLMLILFTGLEKTYILTIWFTKMSILLFYLRIFPDPKFRMIVKGCLIFCGTTIFCLFWACLFKCWPVSYSWTFWDGLHTGKCSSANAQGWANAALHILGDLIVLVLPLRTIWKMRMSWGKKFGILFMFSVGIFITVVSMVRLDYLKYYGFSENPTWDFTYLTLWSCFEVQVGIVCACLPGTLNFYQRVICGRILRKGRFAPATYKRYVPHDHQPAARVKKSELSSEWTDSDVSNLSSATTVMGTSVSFPKDFILVTSDVEIQETSADLPSARPFVEEWPVRHSRQLG